MTTRLGKAAIRWMRFIGPAVNPRLALIFANQGLRDPIASLLLG